MAFSGAELRAQSNYATPYTFTTLAGSAASGITDGTGSAARFYHPQGVAVDGSGNLYVADTSNHTVRKITAGGVVTTLAGSPGNSGTVDGTGSAARFNSPYGVAVDGSGNLYIADTNNCTIRKITAGGVVTTLAGSPGVSGSADGTGSAARFFQPYGVAVDGSGNVYVTDPSNSTIRRITASGVVTTLAGSPGVSGSADGTGSAARFNQPAFVTVDVTGNVYVADTWNATIRKITAAGVVTTLADGTGSAARFNQPQGVAVDGSGNIYVANTWDHTIRKITAAGVVTTLAGSAGVAGSADGTGNAARFANPTGVAVDGVGNVYVADYSNNPIRKITVAGVVTTLAGLAGGSGSPDGTGSAARFYQPGGVAVDGSGNVYVADYGSTIRKITAGGVVTTLAGSPGVSGSADGTGSAARFYRPSGVAVDGAGNVYVADYYNYTIRKITAGGVVTTLAGSPGASGSADGTGSAARFIYAQGVAVDGSGTVYVADGNNYTIRKITSDGVVTTLAGSPGAYYGSADGTGSAARFSTPAGVAVDGTGNVYVADRNNNTIRKGSLIIVASSIINHPSSQARTAGQNASFNVTGNGYPVPTFLWQVSTDGGITWSSLSDSSIYSGSATTTLTVTNATVSLSGEQFQCIASNSAGSATSNPATLTVTKGTATVTLGNLSQAYTDSVVGATATTSPDGLAVTFTYNGSATAPTNLGSYSVVATVNDANYQGTASGTFTVSLINTQPLSQTVTTGQGTVFTAGLVGSPPLACQWQRLPAGANVWIDLADGGNYSGSATPTLTITGATNAMSGDQFRCVATGSAGSSTSNPAILTVNLVLSITTLAGSPGVSGSTDGTGSAARFSTPAGVAVDGAGNVYVADSSNHTIRKITAAGVVTTLAGSPGASGSADGTGSAARFYGPRSVAVDGAGNVYVADFYNYTIRKITPSGVVTTLAGSARVGGSADRTGSAARFYSPIGVAVDGAGNVYVADFYNDTIRKITPGGVVTTLAGSAGVAGSADGTGSAARFYYPYGVAVDGAGNIYVADSGNDTIRKITPSGVVTTLAGSAGAAGSTDGTGSAARFYNLTGVAVDGVGNVYVADDSNHTIRKITAGGVVSTMAGSAGVFGSSDGIGGAARFYYPYGVAVDGSGNVYVADTSNQTIRMGSLIVAPAVITHPSNQAMTAGQNASFTVAASGTPAPTFRWQISTDGGITWSNLSDNSIYSGSATATLTVTNATVSLSSEQFQCVVTSAAGSATSNPATLSVTKATATVTLGSLSRAYTGSAVVATATTSPGGLTVTFTYNDSATAPTNPGSYRVTATVSDTNYLGTASGTLIIQPNFAAYQSQYFSSGQLADPTVSGPSANPAHDGMDNLLKYAFGLDPTLVDSAADLPVAGQTAGALTLSYIRRHDISDLAYTVEVSSDLVTWQSGPSYTQELSVTPLDAQRDQVLVTDLAPLSGSIKRFIRLRVTQP